MSSSGYNPREVNLKNKILALAPPTRFYHNVNRDYLKQALAQMYICEAPYVEFSHILRHHRQTGVSSESLSKLFNDVRTISVDSLEGNVFISGEQHVDEMMVVKYNKPRVPGSFTDPTMGLLHEFVVGSFLNQLRAQIPNFMYVYDHFECEEPRGNLVKGAAHRFCQGTLQAGHVCTEFLRARPLEEIVLEVSTQELGQILLALFCALEIANAKFGYVHYDFHSKNVMVREEVRPISIQYPLGAGLSVTSKYIPVVIDYGFSRIVVEGETYSLKFESNSIPSHPRMYEENHPFVDFHKLITHLLTILLSDGKFTPAHRDFFEQWGVKLQEYFSPSDYRVYQTALTLGTATPEQVQQFLQRTYYTSYFYPTGLGRECSYLKIAEPLLRYKDDYTKTTKCSRMTQVLERIYNLDKGVPVHTPCNGEVVLKDKYGKARTPMDCAKKYSDGNYQVVEFTPEFRFYQGSGESVAANRSVHVSEANNRPILIFRDRSDALRDSSASQALECGDKCVMAFQFKTTLPLFILNTGNIEILRERVSRSLSYLLFLHTYPQELQARDGLATITQKMTNIPADCTERMKKWMKQPPSIVIGLEQIDYLLIRVLLEYLEPQGYHGIVLESPFTLFISGRMREKVRRYYGDPRDWQFSDDKYVFGAMGRLMRDFDRYKSLDEKRAGNLLQHSVWTTLFAQWMFRHQYPATIGMEKLRKTLLLTAFVHDIGEGGDLVFSYTEKPDHYTRGEEYIRTGKYTTSEGVIDLNGVWKEAGISSDQIGFLRFSVKYLGVIGSILDRCSTSECARELVELFLEKCDSGQVPANKQVRIGLFNFVYTVWVANAMASQPFVNREKLKKLVEKIRRGDKSPQYFNDYVEEFPMLTNLPGIRPGKDQYESYAEKDANGVYKIAGRGEELRRAVISRIEAKYP